jgi:hypothetical protein
MPTRVSIGVALALCTAAAERAIFGKDGRIRIGVERIERSNVTPHQRFDGGTILNLLKNSGIVGCRSCAAAECNGGEGERYELAHKTDPP